MDTASRSRPRPPLHIAVGAVLALVLLVVSNGTAPAGEGCVDLAQAPTSRWRVVVEQGVTWLRTPCGDRFFSVGVNVVDGGPDSDRPSFRFDRHYPDPDAFVQSTRRRLHAWGFNTLGAWSLPPRLLDMPVTPNLELGRNSAFHWFDPFHPEMGRIMRMWALHLTGPYRGNSYRIGYFSDNEVGWWNGPLYTYFMARPSSNHTRRRLVDFLREHYNGDWSAFATDFETAGITSFDNLLTTRHVPRLRIGGRGIHAVRRWTGVVAEHYYRLVHDALRFADPDALILGDRLPIYYDPMAVRAMARYVDVIAVNYNVDSPDGWIARYFFDGLRQLAGKPVLVSEWFFAAHENRSANRNNGHLMTVATQTDRARGAGAAMRNFSRLAEIIGVHWFQFYDHPTGGRADGEDYNFGLIDIHNEPYQELVTALRRASEMVTLRAGTGPPATHVTAQLPYARIDTSDGHLADWPKPESLLLPMFPSAGEVAFGDVYASWSERGLAVALIAMDYQDPELLRYEGQFPSQEAFRVDVGIDAGAGPQRFTLTFRPQPRGPHDPYHMLADICRSEPTGCVSVDGAEIRYHGADQPRIVAETVVPWASLGIQAPPTDARLKLDIAVTAFHRSRWMSWSGADPGRLVARPEDWRPVRLGRPSP